MNELTDDQIADRLSDVAIITMNKVEQENNVDFSDFNNKACQDLFQTQVEIIQRFCGTKALSLMIQKMIYAAKQTN